ncbi:MAG TPA: ABC transporter substrate-binding protein [Cellulomonas sp.]
MNRTRPARTVAIAAVGLVSALALTSCSATRTETEETTAAGSSTDACTTDAGGSSQGITDDTILLGMFTPLTGSVADPGNGALDGFNVALDLVNAAGGIQGRQVELVTEDDQYDASVALQAARRLNEEDEVFAFAGGVGTPNFVGVLPYIEENSIPSIGPYAPSNQVGVMENPDVFMIWPNFIDEFEVGMTYALGTDDAPSSVSLVRLIGDTGDDATTGLENALGEVGMELADIEEVESTTTDFSSIALSLKNTGADMVATIITNPQTAQLIEAMNQVGYYPQLLAQSDMTDESYISQYGDISQGMIVPTKVAPFSTDDDLVQEFVTNFTEATGEAPSMWNAVGYVQALVTFEALEQAPVLTRECLEQTLVEMDGFATGLIPPVTFGEDSRQGTNAVGVGIIEGDEVVEAAPFQVVGGE